MLCSSGTNTKSVSQFYTKLLAEVSRCSYLTPANPGDSDGMKLLPCSFPLPSGKISTAVSQDCARPSALPPKMPLGSRLLQTGQSLLK